jgi:hypothetical protein
MWTGRRLFPAWRRGRLRLRVGIRSGGCDLGAGTGQLGSTSGAPLRHCHRDTPMVGPEQGERDFLRKAPTILLLISNYTW